MQNEELKNEKQVPTKLNDTQSTTSTMTSEPVGIRSLRDKLNSIDNKYEEEKRDYVPKEDLPHQQKENKQEEVNEDDDEDDDEGDYEDEDDDSEEEGESDTKKQTTAPNKIRYDEGIVVQRLGDCTH